MALSLKRKKGEGPVEVDGSIVQTDDTGQLFDDELSGTSPSADESEADVVSVLVGSDDGGDERVGSGVLVHVGCVHALRELGLLVVLVLGVDAHLFQNVPKCLSKNVPKSHLNRLNWIKNGGKLPKNLEKYLKCSRSFMMYLGIFLIFSCNFWYFFLI